MEKFEIWIAKKKTRELKKLYIGKEGQKGNSGTIGLQRKKKRIASCLGY